MEAVLLQAAGRQRAGLGSGGALRSDTERSSKEGTQSDREEGREGETNSPDHTERCRRDSVCQQRGDVKESCVFMHF